MTERSDDKSPMQHIVSILSFGCSKRGDLVSIAPNTRELPLIYNGELHSVKQPIVVFFLLVLASGDLTPVFITGIKLRFRDGSIGNETVSWLVHPAHGVIDSRMPVTLDGSVTVATFEYIELDLLVCTSLPIDPTPDSFQKATTMIEQHRLIDTRRDLIARADDNGQSTYQSMAAEIARLEPDGKGPLSTFRRRFLALALDRGLALTDIPHHRAMPTLNWAGALGLGDRAECQQPVLDRLASRRRAPTCMAGTCMGCRARGKRRKCPGLWPSTYIGLRERKGRPDRCRRHGQLAAKATRAHLHCRSAPAKTSGWGCTGLQVTLLQR